MFMCKSNCPEFVELNHVKRPRFYKTRRIIALCTKLVEGNVKKINPFSVVISHFWLIRPLFPKPSVPPRAKGEGPTPHYSLASRWPALTHRPTTSTLRRPGLLYYTVWSLICGGWSFCVFFYPQMVPGPYVTFLCRGLNTARTDVCTPVHHNRNPLPSGHNSQQLTAGR